jgi:hypothetical protein
MLVMSCLAVIFGCSSDNGNGPDPNGNDVTELVEEANTELADVLFDLANNDDINHPDSIDLTVPYNLYIEALNKDADHDTANFGAGVLEIVMMTQDAQIQDFFDDLDAFFDADSYFEQRRGSLGYGHIVGVRGPIVGLHEVSIPLAVPARMVRAFGRVGSQTDPTVDELQQICFDEVLPRIATCIQRLVKVTANQDFLFTITPKMQGDMYEDPIELDLTEVYATLSGLNALRAVLLHFMAYDFNLDEYTGDAMLDAITPGSAFGSLHAAGTNRMQTALQSWRDAVDYLESGVDFLESETDYQGDDFIYVDPYDDFTQADLDSIKRYIPVARNILTTSDEIKADWDDNFSTPDEKIRFSLYSFYDDPVGDLKTLLPDYTAEVTLSPAETEWTYKDTVIDASVTIAASGYYYWERFASFCDDGPVDSWEDANIAVPEWETAWDTYYAMLEGLPYAHMEAYFYSYLSAGQQSVYCTFYMDYEDVEVYRYIPVLTWEADTYEDWILPDPTMGGLMPDMTDQHLKDLLGIDAGDWEKTVELDLWDW